jgi:aldose 1-epimerase
MADDAPRVQVHQISAGRLSARILNFGATLMELAVAMPGGVRPVTLSLGTPEAYVHNPHYLGVIAGRCANRIRGGECVIDGRVHQLDRNENGRTHLHGGEAGFSRRYWTVEDTSPTVVELNLRSKDGDQGYPGNVEVTCRYEIIPDNTLRITLTGRTDATTLLGLAAHSYFNLEPGTSLLDHTLQIQASHYTPVDADLIPDGRILAVDGSCFDFRTPIAIGSRRAESRTGYDHNMVLAAAPRIAPQLAVTLGSPSGDLTMNIVTTEPGLQFYDGQKLSGGPEHAMAHLRPFAGGCFEPQRYPDAVHHQGFASPVLRVGEVYRQVTEYRFT